MTKEAEELLSKLDHNLNDILFDLVDENETLEGQVDELREQVARLAERGYENPTGDLISRQAVLDSLKEHRALYCDNTPETFSKLSYAEKSRVDELDTAIATIINLPSVENKGEWIESKERSKHWYCSVCGGIHTDPETGKWRETFDYRYPFCPNCGADMRGEE